VDLVGKMYFRRKISPKWEMRVHLASDKVVSSPGFPNERGEQLKTGMGRILLFVFGCAIAVPTVGPLHAQCTDMSNSVSGKVKVNGNEVIAWLTNNSGTDLYVFYTFKERGGPSHNMANAGSGSLYAGKTNGGEGGGMYTYSADTNPAEIYWYAVPKSEHDKYGCIHTW
jgi:hypothetical protein